MKLNQRAEVRLAALDIKGAFDSVWWQGLLCHLQNIRVIGLAYPLFTSAAVTDNIMCMQTLLVAVCVVWFNNDITFL